MKRTPGFCALLVLAAMTTACGFDILEDIGTDPHPPAVEITGLVHYVAPPPGTADRAASSPPGRTVSWDSGGFTLSTGQSFQIGIAYSDSGGDIVKFQLRDRDGALRLDLAPTELTYFPGTSGTLLGPETGQELTGIYGNHRLELWAEDSHLSRSEKVEFIVTLVP